MVALHPASLAFVSKGDPLSPRTWSGTTANIWRALTAAGVAVTPLDCSQPAPPRAVELAVKRLSKLCYLSIRQR